MIRLGEGNRCDKSGGKLSSSRDDLMSKSYNRITIISKLLVGDIGAKMFIFSHWKLNDNHKLVLGKIQYGSTNWR